MLRSDAGLLTKQDLVDGMKQIDPLLSPHDIQELEEWFGSICPDIGVALPDFLTLTHKLDKPAPRSEFFKEVKALGVVC